MSACQPVTSTGSDGSQLDPFPGTCCGRFLKKACEWSNSVAPADCFWMPAPQHEVRLLRKVGLRWEIWDPTTEGHLAYVDRDAMTVPASLEQANDQALPAGKTVVVCIDSSAQDAARQQAVDGIGQWVSASARSGDTYYFRWITDDSYSAQAAIGHPLQVPTDPTLEATPTPPSHPNPFDLKEQAAVKTVVAGQQQQQTDVRRQLADANTARETAVQAAVKELRDAVPARSPGSDVWGCAKKAADIFSTQTIGDRFLLLASNLADGGKTTANFKMPQTQVRVIYFDPGSGEARDQRQAEWQGLLEAAQAANVKFYPHEVGN